jgi:hypothetical protein
VNGDCTNGYKCSGNTCQCQLPNIVCQGTCLDGANDTNNCGACGHVCKLGCTQSQCSCAAPDANVVPNPGFDSNLDGWGGPGSWVSDDAVECSSSGSARVTTLDTSSVGVSFSANDCFPIVPTSTTYNTGARVRSRPGSAAGVVYLEVYFQSGAHCGGSSVAFVDVRTAAVVTPTTTWTTLANPVISGVTGAASVLFEFHIKKTDQSAAPFDVELDMPYLSPAPGVGWR